MSMNILIGIPCMDTVPVEFMTSMINLRKPSETKYATVKNSLIYDSRNVIAAKGIQEYDAVMWLDSDMMFDPDALNRLTEPWNQKTSISSAGFTSSASCLCRR